MASFKSNNLSGFTFQKVSSGAYKVTYTTPIRGDYYVARIEDMTLIDATKNADVAKVKDIQYLYNAVKRNGSHYNCKGERID